jgi:transcriptional regulator with XRE-family HTH domain
MSVPDIPRPRHGVENWLPLVERLFAIMKAKKMPLKTLAAQTGMMPDAMRAWRGNKRAPTVESLERAFNALDYTLIPVPVEWGIGLTGFGRVAAADADSAGQLVDLPGPAGHGADFVETAAEQQAEHQADRKAGADQGIAVRHGADIPRRDEARQAGGLLFGG